MMKLDRILKKMKALSDPEAVAGMARFGINKKNTLGVSMPEMRRLARETGHDQELALALWKCGFHEGRILAGLVAEPEKVTLSLMDKWVKDFDSWDVCDQNCLNLFWKIDGAWNRAKKWAGRNEEFVRRAGFALMAVLAVHDKGSPDKRFLEFFPLIEKQATDERNFVKKAVNWALRQIGKRSPFLKKEALALAGKIKKQVSRTAAWIANDAIRELNGKTFGPDGRLIKKAPKD
jgi:3-methyladenine DNA glycosylase AlkD